VLISSVLLLTEATEVSCCRATWPRKLVTWSEYRRFPASGSPRSISVGLNYL